MSFRAARRFLSSGVLVCMLAAPCAAPRTAQAASRVVLLRAAGADALARQGTTLLEAELHALGFEAITVDGDGSRDLRNEIELVSGRLQPVATFAILPVAGGTTVELWLEDRVTGKLVIRRVAVTLGPGAAADLAVKAVELLRGSLLEVNVRRQQADQVEAPPPPTEVRRFIAGADSRWYFSDGVGISVGALAVRNFALASSYAPVVRVAWGNGNGYLFRLTASGLGSPTTVRAVEGEANVQQTLLLAAASRVFRPRTRLQPYCGFAAGAQRVHSAGTGVSVLFSNKQGNTTAFTLGAEAGLAVRLGNRVALHLDLALLVSLPRTSITIASREVAKAGGPLLTAGIGIAAAF